MMPAINDGSPMMTPSWLSHCHCNIITLNVIIKEKNEADTLLLWRAAFTTPLPPIEQYAHYAIYIYICMYVCGAIHSCLGYVIGQGVFLSLYWLANDARSQTQLNPLYTVG